MNIRFHLKRALGALGIARRKGPALRAHQFPARFAALFDPADQSADIAIEYLRGLHMLALPITGAHPFVRAAAAARAQEATPAREAAAAEVLAAFYLGFTPANAAEVLGLTAREAPVLAGLPPAAALLPWSRRTPAQTAKGRALAMREVGWQFGRRLGPEDGITAFGPVSPAKLALETTRVAGLVGRVAQEGFRQDDRAAPMTAVALRRGEDMRFMVEEGHHRLPVAAVFGITRVRLRIVGLISADSVADWPRVADGTFTPQAARRVFDRIFDGAGGPY